MTWCLFTSKETLIVCCLIIHNVFNYDHSPKSKPLHDPTLPNLIHLEPGLQRGSASPDTQRKCPLIFSCPEQCPNGYRIISPDSDDAGTRTLRLASQRRAGRPWRWLVVFGDKTTRAKLPRAPAPRRPHARRQTQWQSFGLACMIRLQTWKASEKTTTLDWVGPSACCRGNHIQQAHTVGRHSVDSVFRSFHAPSRISASSGNE
jgi:hypothetical protein